MTKAELFEELESAQARIAELEAGQAQAPAASDSAGADYVAKLESDNAALRKDVSRLEAELGIAASQSNLTDDVKADIRRRMKAGLSRQDATNCALRQAARDAETATP